MHRYSAFSQSMVAFILFYIHLLEGKPWHNDKVSSILWVVSKVVYIYPPLISRGTLLNGVTFLNSFVGCWGRQLCLCGLFNTSDRNYTIQHAGCLCQICQRVLHWNFWYWCADIWSEVLEKNCYERGQFCSIMVVSSLHWSCILSGGSLKWQYSLLKSGHKASSSSLSFTLHAPLLTGFYHYYTILCSWLFFFIMLLICTKWGLIHCRYHLDLCKNVFGEGIFPDVDATNLYYGGTKIAGLETCLSWIFIPCPQLPSF